MWWLRLHYRFKLVCLTLSSLKMISLLGGIMVSHAYRLWAGWPQGSARHIETHWNPRGRHSSCPNLEPSFKATEYLIPSLVNILKGIMWKCAKKMFASDFTYKVGTKSINIPFKGRVHDVNLIVLKFASFYNGFRLILYRLVFIVKSNSKCWITCQKS